MNICRLARQAGALAVIGTIALLTGDAARAQVSTFEGIYGGTKTDFASSVISTMDNSYVGVAITEGDIMVVKTDRCGGIIWSNLYDLGGAERVYKIRETPEGEYVAVGEISYDNGDVDAFLLKLRSTGTIRWGKTYGTDESVDLGFDLRVDPANGDIYAAGYTHSITGAFSRDGWIFKTDDDGVQSWSQRYGGSSFDMFYAIELGCNGDVIAAGGTQSHQSWSGSGRQDIDIYAVRVTAASGALTWGYIYGVAGIDERASSLVKNGISSIYIAGTRTIRLPRQETWGLLLEVHCTGGYLADEAYYDEPVPTDDFDDGTFTDIQILPNQNLIVTGSWSEVDSGTVTLRRRFPLMEIDALTLNPAWTRIYTAGYQGYGVAVVDDNIYDSNWNLIGIGSSITSPFGPADLYMVATDENGLGVCTDEESTLVAIDPDLEELEIMPKLNPLPGEVEVTPTLLPYGSYDLPCECEQGIIAPPGGPGLSDYVRPRGKGEDLVAVRAKRVSP